MIRALEARARELYRELLRLPVVDRPAQPDEEYPRLTRAQRAGLPPVVRELLERRDRDGIEAASAWYAALTAEAQLEARTAVLRLAFEAEATR